MVIHKIDVVYITRNHSEDNAPISGNCHAPISLEFTLERMKSVTGQVHVCWLCCVVEMGEYIFNSANQHWVYTTGIALMI